MKNIPRIRARLAQYEEPKELENKWCFEITMWTFDGETQVGDPIGPFGPFETENEAKIEMRKAAKLAAESIEKKVTGEVSGKYLDMKSGGILRSWEEQ